MEADERRDGRRAQSHKLMPKSHSGQYLERFATGAAVPRGAPTTRRLKVKKGDVVVGHCMHANRCASHRGNRSGIREMHIQFYTLGLTLLHTYGVVVKFEKREDMTPSNAKRPFLAHHLRTSMPRLPSSPSSNASSTSQVLYSTFSPERFHHSRTRTLPSCHSCKMSGKMDLPGFKRTLLESTETDMQMTLRRRLLESGFTSAGGAVEGFGVVFLGEERWRGAPKLQNLGTAKDRAGFVFVVGFELAQPAGHTPPCNLVALARLCETSSLPVV
ncbi:hypothetical protein KC337_g113 [Hortaea werneckii]|nr:hypothetical protein KC337_g113 [Hortaea werneckii]